MARPRAHELTERELELMHVFWDDGQLTAQEARERLAARGRSLAYTTVATLVRILHEKEFLEQTNDQRPFAYRARRSFDEVSRSLLGNLIDRVFGGSREQLLLRMFGERQLSRQEREVLEQLLQERDR